jgi:branched-chain amino acid transport system permease protein
MITLQLLVNGILLGGIYALISIGLTLIFGVIRIINFAHGEFLMLSMYFTFFLYSFVGLDPYVALFIVAPVLFLLGLVTQRFIIQPLMGAPPLSQVFATFGLSVALQSLALFLWTGNFRSVKTPYAQSIIKISTIMIPFPRLVMFLVAIAIIIILYVFLRRTYLGSAITAVVQDRIAALLVGINVRVTYLLTFGIGSACVGIAGALMMPSYYAHPTIGLSFGMMAFVVVVLGGLGNMLGAIAAGIIIGIVESFTGFYIDFQLSPVFYYAIFIAVLLIKPSGIFGMVGEEEMGLK